MADEKDPPLRTSRKWRDADQQHETAVTCVHHPVADVCRRPDHHPFARGTALVADDELAGALDDEVELVLSAVNMRVLLLSGVESRILQLQNTASNP